MPFELQIPFFMDEQRWRRKGKKNFESVEKLIKPEAAALLLPFFFTSSSRTIVIFVWKIEFSLLHWEWESELEIDFSLV